jgi:hypothetical protein
MGMQLVERWEGLGTGARYQIDVERLDTIPGRELFNIRLSRNARPYESTFARSGDLARERVQHAVNWGLAFGPTTYRRTFRDDKLAPRSVEGQLQLTCTPNPHEIAAKLAVFLTIKTGNCNGRWEGTMLADTQRALFGRFLGKGTVVIDGATERIKHRVSRRFGLDYEYTANLRWTELV